MYRARSSLQKIGRDLIRMNAAISWTMRSVRVSQAFALRSQTSCSRPTWSPPRNRRHYHLTNTRSPVPLLASLRCTPQPDCGPCRVLRGGHVACILVERVEKPTDNGSASLLCCGAADADFRAIGPSLALTLFPRPLHAPGPAATSTLGLAQLLTRPPRFNPCAVSRGAIRRTLPRFGFFWRAFRRFRLGSRFRWPFRDHRRRNLFRDLRSAHGGSLQENGPVAIPRAPHRQDLSDISAYSFSMGVSHRATWPRKDRVSHILADARTGRPAAVLLGRRMDPPL